MARQNPKRRAGARRGGASGGAGHRGAPRVDKKPGAAGAGRRAGGNAGADRGDAVRPHGAGPTGDDLGAAPAVFRLGAVPGAMPGKWIERWREQRPETRLELVPISAAGQRAALDTGDVDAAIVRLPIDGDPDELHTIRLYDEVAVVVASKESSLMAADELTPDDLAGEVLITPTDDVLGDLGLPIEAATFGAPATTEDAIEIVASGVGIVVVPMSLARLHHRRDVDHRPLADDPSLPVALAWLRERDADDVQHFAAITRGRGARSSR
ncbi:Putative LysR-family transcriptional regulator [Frigoribacterium sp. JB110]|nr:Putative LysR-family transcriptional regulator [Frigoribacterium sp. JB110]